MTMVMAARTISASRFKAECLALLDEVAVTGPLTVTKRGKPVARVVEAHDAPRAGPAQPIEQRFESRAPVHRARRIAHVGDAVGHEHDHLVPIEEGVLA